MEDARSCGRKRSFKEGVSAQAGDGFDEKEIERLAVESLIQEAKRRKVRAEQAGPSGWTKRPALRTNKRFLNTVVAGSVATNRRKESTQQRRLHERECSHDSQYKKSSCSRSNGREKSIHLSTKSVSSLGKKESREQKSRLDDSADIKVKTKHTDSEREQR